MPTSGRCLSTAREPSCVTQQIRRIALVAGLKLYWRAGGTIKACVAVANKMARMAWVIMAKGETYRVAI